MKNRELLELLQKAELEVYEIDPNGNDGDDSRWKAMTWIREAIDEVQQRLRV